MNWRAWAQFGLLCLAACAQAAPFCASPGRDGSSQATGVINDYWAAPAGAQLAVGQTRLPLGVQLGKGRLDAGDLLLVIQMQDASIDSANDARYGSGRDQGSGWLELAAGRFELVRVQRVEPEAVVVSGTGPGAGLQFAYHYRDPVDRADQGRARWQLVRVPQYRDLTLAGDLQAAPWNGATGGVLALDVRGELALAGHRLDVTGKGFRGGAALPLAGALGAPGDYRYVAPSAQNLADRYGQHGSKGEGLAGTPRWLFVQNQRVETLPDAGRNSSDGYPGGSMARGAPANAGGGGESLSLDNRVISAGGGGGGAVAGGKGTDAKGKPDGGVGGAGVGGFSSLPLLVMGGGGGASALGGRPAWQGAGGAGGGILLVLAGKLTDKGQLSVAGSEGRKGPAGGGGGGGGSLLLWSPLALPAQVALQLAGGGGGKGAQGTGGAGGAGRLLTAGGVDAPASAARVDTGRWPGVLPGFVCQPDGLVVTGQVFDAGQAASTANAPGLMGWRYRLTADGKALASGVTDSHGRFSLSLPALAQGRAVQLEVKLPTGWQAASAKSDAATGLVWLGAGRWQLTPASGGYYQELRLGVVQSPELSESPVREVAPNTTQIFPLRYVAHASGSVSFAASAGFNGERDAAPLLFLDPRCDGHSQFAANGASGVFDVVPGQTFCVRLRIEVGEERKAGDRLAWRLVATTRLGHGLAPLVQEQAQQYVLSASAKAD